MAADRTFPPAPAPSRSSRLVLALAAGLAAVALAAPARAALTVPTPLAPTSGAAVDALPAFAWSRVAGADRYEFQVAADAGFNSPVLGKGDDDFFTRNTRATLKKTVPNGTYYWRVRAVGPDGSVSSWSAGRSLKKQWTAAAALQNPAGGAPITFPGSGLALGWSAVAGAAHYLVSVASDPQLGSLVTHDDSDPNGPPKVQATTLAIGGALAALGLVAAVLLERRRRRRLPPPALRPLYEFERALRRARFRGGPGMTLSRFERDFSGWPGACGYVRALREQRYSGRSTAPTPEQRRGLRAALARDAGVLRSWWALPPLAHRRRGPYPPA
jgi:hypothetical protein